MTELGQYLRQLRGKRSLREVADLTHGTLSHNTISLAERGINTRGKEYLPGPEVLRELAKAYNVDPIKLMKLAGYIQSTDKLPKNAIPISAEVADQPVMVYGEIQAGVAKWAEQDIIGQINVTKSFAKRYGAKNLFALQVDGESMNREIPNGYTAVFSKDLEPESGDIVAVIIDSENATIKRFRETSLAIMFEPSSWDPSFKPYVFPKDGIQDFKIIGKFLYATSECI